MGLNGVTYIVVGWRWVRGGASGWMEKERGVFFELLCQRPNGYTSSA